MTIQNDPMCRQSREILGQFRGYTEVQGPVMFLVPIQQIKPANPYKINVPVAWRGDKTQTFEIGKWYVLTAFNAPIHGWEASAAEATV